MKVIGVGDNTVDKYLHRGVMFPGGNAVNVAVLAKRYGAEASYIGWLGNDVFGNLIMDSLQKEGIDTSHCRVLDAPNANSEVTLVDGDRVFGNSSHGVCPQIQLTDDDYTFISQHDLTHTSIYSYLEKDLEKLGKASPVLSFDYSQNWTRPYLSETLRPVNIAILSAPDYSADEIKDLMRWVLSQGPYLALITKGKDGAIVYDGKEFFYQKAAEANVVDTLGAGDAFAARFLVEYLDDSPIDIALEKAAESAAIACGYYGAFGYGIPIPE